MREVKFFEVKKEREAPFSIFSEMINTSIYALTNCTSGDAAAFFRFVMEKTRRYEVTITLVYDCSAINYQTYIQRKGTDGISYPLGYISSGFSAGYAGTGSYTFVQALGEALGYALPEEMEDIIFGASSRNLDNQRGAIIISIGVGAESQK
jgi:hypothetical protein